MSGIERLNNRKQSVERFKGENWLTKKIDASLETPADPTKANRSGVFHASKLGSECDRELWLHYHGKLVGESIDGHLQRIFDHGHATESRYMTYFTNMGVLKAREVPARIEDPPIHGRADFLLKFPNYLIIELKTINSDKFNQLREPKHDHLIQIQTYLNILEIEDGIVVYENKNDQRIREFKITRDKDLWQEVIDRCKRIQKMTDIPKLTENYVHPPWCGCIAYDKELLI